MNDAEPHWRTGYAHPAAWDQTYAPLSVPEMFARSVARAPDARFLDFLGRHYSYTDVAFAVDRVACGLARLGIARGDRVGLFLPNTPHYVAAYYGALRLGATVVNFSPLYTIEELAHQVADSGTRLLVTLSATALLPTALEVLRQSALERLVVGSVAGVLPPAKSLLYRLFRRREVSPRPHDPRITAFSDLIANDGQGEATAIDPLRDVALIQYTGGTTGTPKGACLTHQALTANARQMMQVDPHANEADRIIGVLPLFHIFANACVLNRTVMAGGEIVMLPRFDAGQVLAAIDRTRPTAMPGVPTMFQALLDHPRLGRTHMESLRVCISGGAPLPRVVATRFEAVTRDRLVEGYGLTECGIVSTNPYEGVAKEGTIGQPLPGTRIRLLDRGDPARPAPPGEPGELAIAGPQIAAGYWNRPDLQAETFAGGYFRTGDVATIDADGYLRIVDRLKDMISVGGFKVFPSQVESVLYRHPAVREAIVIGVPDAYMGERPKAFVTLKPGVQADAAEITAWANPQLGKHERVAAVEIRAALPKTMIGKLSRKELVAEERAKAEAPAVAPV